MNAAVRYFIISLALAAVVGFVYSAIARFVSRRADKMGKNQKQKKGEEITCQKSNS